MNLSDLIHQNNYAKLTSGKVNETFVSFSGFAIEPAYPFPILLNCSKPFLKMFPNTLMWRGGSAEHATSNKVKIEIFRIIF